MSKYVPGPCNFCGSCQPLRTLPGSAHDGICETCDELRFRLMHPGLIWVSWKNQEAARKEAAAKRRAVAQGTVVPLRQAS